MEDIPVAVPVATSLEYEKFSLQIMVWALNWHANNKEIKSNPCLLTPDFNNIVKKIMLVFLNKVQIQL